MFWYTVIIQSYSIIESNDCRSHIHMSGPITSFSLMISFLIFLQGLENLYFFSRDLVTMLVLLLNSDFEQLRLMEHWAQRDGIDREFLQAFLQFLYCQSYIYQETDILSYTRPLFYCKFPSINNLVWRRLAGWCSRRRESYTWRQGIDNTYQSHRKTQSGTHSNPNPSKSADTADNHIRLGLLTLKLSRKAKSTAAYS